MENTTIYNLNITEFPAREIPKVWKPKSILELEVILSDANKEMRQLYPISTGHNWGLGSKLPVENSEVVDLSEMNEIIEVNKDLCYARIQPGVTQKQLSDYLALHFPNLMLNVTGSDAHSSILGNTLERGSGKNGHRASDLRELQVLLADGSSISTGFGGIGESKKDSFYKYGLGPDITHLFTQSNYGIVVEGVISLMTKQPFDLFLAKIPESNLGVWMEIFSKLVRTDVIGNSLELDSQNDPKIFELFDQQEMNDSKVWIGWFVIYGDSEIRKAKVGKAKKELESVCLELKTYNSGEENKDVPIPVNVRLNRYEGIPSDHSLIATAKSFGVDLDESNPDIDLHKEMPGFRCVLPVIPFSSAAADTLNFIYEFSRKHSFNPATSVIALDPYSLEVFCRVHFDRKSGAEIAAAGEWAKGLLISLRDKGIFPYRLDIDSMKSYLNSLSDPSIKWKKSIKDLLDPNNTIAPGRYII